MILVNATKRTILSDRCHFANTVVKRMVGLLSRKTFEPGEGLLLDRCYGIHTFGMRFSIDVLFLDQDYRVIRAVPAIPPFRACTAKRSMYVLELPAGSIERTQTTAGDQVQIRAAADTRATSFAVPNAAASAPPA